MIPFYISEALKAYLQMSSEDRRDLLDDDLFNTDPLTCNEKYLPYFAKEAGIDTRGLSKDEIRAAINNSASWNAGTIGNLKKSLSFFGDLKVVEKGGYRFDVDFSVSNKEVTPAFANTVKNNVIAVKNARSKLDELILSYKAKAALKTYIGGVAEICANTKQIDGYTTKTGLINLTKCGAVAEIVATAKMEV